MAHMATTMHVLPAVRLVVATAYLVRVGGGGGRYLGIRIPWHRIRIPTYRPPPPGRV